jgi:hypothetical protein
MYEYKPTSVYAYLYKVLDKFDTPRLQCYLLACQEQQELDGVSVAANILRVRFINGE